MVTVGRTAVGRAPLSRRDRVGAVLVTVLSLQLMWPPLTAAAWEATTVSRFFAVLCATLWVSLFYQGVALFVSVTVSSLLSSVWRPMGVVLIPAACAVAPAMLLPAWPAVLVPVTVVYAAIGVMAAYLLRCWPGVRATSPS
ncbi:hypothetical protein LX16_1750 [Stackebrandtia albiflava]|uniref:Uncharacterized protein n=1 Tax=Stackebrandtia albiflava TaxID=406432 RepID=A0A562VDS8_9ACTN|nr:hypothetical protein [Stackebrandtia albiflava]TWJ16030.1 hypothetical protein LX16_1750 [Stackebrandtia albiflava]